MRERWVDNVKGFAIYLVVLGHCIQYASHNGYDYANNTAFKLIYSFHMPLFMLLSGYLFWYTLSKYSFFDGIIAKLKGIMVPCLTWGLVTYMLDILLNDYRPVSLYGYWHYTVYSNWFLWAVFYCSLVGFVSKYLFKGKLIGYVLILCCNYFIPVVANTTGAKRLMPFFILGIMLNQYKVLERLKETKSKIVIFFVLCITYIAAMRIVPDIEILTGIPGSLLVCFVFWVIADSCKLKLLPSIGQVSIGIYLFTGIVFYFAVKDYLRISESYRYAIRAGYVFGMSVVLTLVSYLLCRLFGKYSITGLLFLGKGVKKDCRRKESCNNI